ncbi:unnamed protein product, partial [Phaeothamnion confervicola]
MACHSGSRGGAAVVAVGRRYGGGSDGGGDGGGCSRGGSNGVHGFARRVWTQEQRKGRACGLEIWLSLLSGREENKLRSLPLPVVSRSCAAKTLLFLHLAAPCSPLRCAAVPTIPNYRSTPFLSRPAAQPYRPSSNHMRGAIKSLVQCCPSCTSPP